MFGNLTEKLQNLFSGLRSKKILTEENISEAVRQVRLALLDADVNFTVVSRFVARVKEKALGGDLLKSVTADQQFIHLVHEELTALMGADEAPLELKGAPAVVMVCGLQGSGKTTSCAKLAAFIKKEHKHKKILLAACDLQRPAAIDQLKKLGAEIEVPVFALEGEKDPMQVAKRAHQKAAAESYDVLIVDTAGRLHLDEELMQELAALKEWLKPSETLFVANAATGQDAVRIAAEFDKRVQMTGVLLTMLDGNARAGAAISIRDATGKPLKFEGIGEKVSDLQLFHPRSMADRILGMGDVINLVKKAKEHIDEETSLEMEAKLRKASFTYEDYLKQMKMVKKMGSFKSLLKMLPGLGSFGDLDFSDKEFGKTEAIILSMTPKERQEREELTFSRRKRVAKGSGVHIDDVNRMVKSFKQIKQLFKNMPDLKGKMKGLPDMKELKKQFEGKKWH
jgi:signal recognition particle subunit SRP54